MTRYWRYVGLGLLAVGLGGCAAEVQPVGPSAAPTTAAKQSAADTEASLPASTPIPAQPTPTFVVATNGTDQPAPSVGVVRLDDDVWQGSYRRANGPTVYGGRSATWIYGTTTEYSAMEATFPVQDQPNGAAELRVEGMDSEDRAKTPIRITINGVEIFNGPNPLPNDDLPYETGTWQTLSWPFDAALLQPGSNTITISNLAPGAFSRPPFFMLDYAEIVYQP